MTTLLRTGPGEPAFTGWRRTPVHDLVTALLVGAQDAVDDGRPWVVAVDGRSAGGKTTLAERLHRAVPRSAVVHTDDVAWHHSFVDWAERMREHVLVPLHAGRAVSWRPPEWVARGRTGAVEVPGEVDLVLVEGVGAGRRELADLVDRSVWVQSDAVEAVERGIVRDGGTPEAEAFWHEWAATEVPFLQDQAPWERAHVVVAGTTLVPHAPATEVAWVALR